MELKILNIGLFDDFKKAISESPKIALDKLQEIAIPVDYFKFYNSVSTVYSSKIEGENIDFDSFFKHKFLNVQYQTDYTTYVLSLYYQAINNTKLFCMVFFVLDCDIVTFIL